MIPCDSWMVIYLDLCLRKIQHDGGDIQTNFSRIHALYEYFEMNPELIKDKNCCGFWSGATEPWLLGCVSLVLREL